MKIAFIGLGNMGGPMALNLHKAGHDVSAFDLSRPACDRLAADGVRIATDAGACVAGAEVVISMLPASPHVEALFLGSDGQPGLLPRLAAGTLVIDCSTIAAAPRARWRTLHGGTASPSSTRPSRAARAAPSPAP